MGISILITMVSQRNPPDRGLVHCSLTPPGSHKVIYVARKKTGALVAGRDQVMAGTSRISEGGHVGWRGAPSLLALGGSSAEPELCSLLSYISITLEPVRKTKPLEDFC